MQKYSNSNTILHHLVGQGYVFSSICMIYWLQSSLSSESKRKAIINPINKEGFTPLHLAAMTHSQEMCKYLLYLGSDPTIKSRSGHTAYDLIKDRDTPASLLKILKPKLTSAYRHKSSPKFYLNLGFLLTRYTIFLIYLIPHIGITLSSISLSLSASTCFLLIYLSSIDPGYMSKSREKLEKLVLDYGDETCTKCCTVQYKSNVVKHCWYCQRCVEKYDHHCKWIRNCVGKGNSHLFMIYLLIFSSELTFHTIMIAVVVLLGFNERSVWKPSSFTPGLQVILILLLILMAAVLFFVIRVLLWQVRRIYKGKTSFQIKYLRERNVNRPRSLYEDYRQKSALTLRTYMASNPSSASDKFIE